MPDPTEQIENSILHDMKQMVGQEWDDNTYDLDLKIHINTVFFDLTQIGVGPSTGFSIDGPETKWDEFVSEPKSLHAIKSYMHLRMRLLFDMPANGFLVTSIEKQIEKMEVRLQMESDQYLTSEEVTNV